MQLILEERICGCCMCDSGRSPSLWYDALLCCLQSYMGDILMNARACPVSEAYCLTAQIIVFYGNAIWYALLLAALTAC